MISDQDRNDLHNGLADVLGEHRAAVLMEHLPPVGWADVATKTDLALLRAELRSEFAEFRTEFKGDLAGVGKEVSDLRTELHQSLRGQTQNLYVGLAAILAGYAGMVVAFAR